MNLHIGLYMDGLLQSKDVQIALVQVLTQVCTPNLPTTYSEVTQAFHYFL